MWCVDATGTAPVFDCVPGLSCASDGGGSDEFTTVAAALSAARSVGGPSDAHHVCIETAGTHTENIVVDNSDGALGSSVDLYFNGEGNDYCPGGAGDAAVMFIGAPNQEPLNSYGVGSMAGDFAACASSSDALFSVQDASLRLDGARLSNFDGHLVNAVAGSESPSVQILGSRAERFTGAMVVGDAGVSLDNSEISGFTPPFGTPLIPGDASATQFANLTYSALFGNVVLGAPLIKIPRGGRLGQLTVAANIVVDYPNLLPRCFTELEAV